MNSGAAAAVLARHRDMNSDAVVVALVRRLCIGFDAAKVLLENMLCMNSGAVKVAQETLPGMSSGVATEAQARELGSIDIVVQVVLAKQPEGGADIVFEAVQASVREYYSSRVLKVALAKLRVRLPVVWSWVVAIRREVLMVRAKHVLVMVIRGSQSTTFS